MCGGLGPDLADVRVTGVALPAGRRDVEVQLRRVDVATLRDHTGGTVERRNGGLQVERRDVRESHAAVLLGSPDPIAADSDLR